MPAANPPVCCLPSFPGEHGVGGRLATRSSADGSLKGAPPGLVFDHAAQASWGVCMNAGWLQVGWPQLPSGTGSDRPILLCSCPSPCPQFFTASDPAFCAMVERWAADGVVARWHGPVGRLRDGAFTRDDSQERWVAPGGMRALAQYLAGQARRGSDLERE